MSIIKDRMGYNPDDIGERMDYNEMRILQLERDSNNYLQWSYRKIGNTAEKMRVNMIRLTIALIITLFLLMAAGLSILKLYQRVESLEEHVEQSLILDEAGGESSE